MRIESWVFELSFIPFVILVIWESYRVFGRERTMIFFWGSIIWTGTLENLTVISGGYDYFAYANYYAINGIPIYGYGGWVAWILFVPLIICLGWFFLSLPALYISNHLLGYKRNIWLKSALAAITLVAYDVFFDPLAVVNEWWRWTSPGFYFRGVPLGNWIGWFFLLFFFGAIYERTVIEKKGFRWLRGIERLVFRRDTTNLNDVEMRRIGRIFYFRLVAFLPLFFAVAVPITLLSTNLWNNRWGPFNNVFPNSALHEQYLTKPAGVVQQRHLPLNQISLETSIKKEKNESNQ